MKKLTSIRVDKKNAQELKELTLEVEWIQISSIDDKLQHLLRFYKNHKIQKKP